MASVAAVLFSGRSEFNEKENEGPKEIYIMWLVGVLTFFQRMVLRLCSCYMHDKAGEYTMGGAV